MAGAKFLLIREIGAGLWNELHHVLTQLLAAEILQRIPVVYWGKGSLYATNDGSDAFEKFFMPVSGYSVNDLANSQFSFCPERWNSGNILAVPGYPDNAANITMGHLEKSEADVCVSDKYIEVDEIIPFVQKGHWLFGLNKRDVFYRLLKKYIRLKDEVREYIDAFYSENMKGTPFLAVHIRSSDKIVEVKHLHELNELYPREIEKVLKANPGMRIFLMTDCIDVLEEYTKKYGELLVYTDCRRVPKNGDGVHYQEYQDNWVKGFEIIRDAWLAARCDYFIGNGHSNVSLGICELKNWEDDRVKLLY